MSILKQTEKELPVENEEIIFSLLKSSLDSALEKDFKIRGCFSEIQISNFELYISNVKKLKKCDYNFARRIYGYFMGTFDHGIKFENLYNPHFYVLREEFFEALVSYGMPSEIALKFPRYGVWAYGEKRERYRTLLEQYNMPSQIMDYYDDVRNLWPSSGCDDVFSELLPKI